MSTYNVVVVDDSALSRKILTESLDAHDEVEVVYAAPNASLAYKYLEKHQVDLVMLDVEMPDINGIEAAGYISNKWPKIPILMCSSLTERGADVTLQALENGASDYIAKPSAKDGRSTFAKLVLEKVLGLLKANGRRETPASSTQESSSLAPAPNCLGSIEALAIGCSTGGPAALTSFYAALKKPYGVPTFIVQHMPPVFTRLLAERLSAVTGFSFKEGEHGEEVDHQTTYIAPGGKHMIVVERKGRRYIELNEDPPEHSCRPAVDVLFRSIADVYREKSSACVLTGMGADGSGGVVPLSKAGCEILVQEPSTCVVPSMPQSSLDTGCVHQVMKLEEIALRFEQRCALSLGTWKKAQ